MVEQIYDSLDAPVYVWEKVHKTLDLTYLLVKRKKVDEKLAKKLNLAWEKMYDEYLQEFGFSEAFLALKKKEMEIALIQCSLILTNDRSFETEIEIAEDELNALKNNLGASDFMDAKKAIEKNMKFQINMNTTSIREFYSYLNDLN